jgi:multifunctional beta-oxidation protein
MRPTAWLLSGRMTETIMPPNVLDKLLPEYVSPLVAYLCSEGLEDSAQIYAVGGGYVSRVAVVEGEGVFIKPDAGLTPEAVAGKWASNGVPAAIDVEAGSRAS